MINIYKCAYGYELIIAEKMQRNERDKKMNGKETQTPSPLPYRHCRHILKLLSKGLL